jgi:hypothetical protein
MGISGSQDMGRHHRLSRVLEGREQGAVVWRCDHGQGSEQAAVQERRSAWFSRIP